MGRQRSWSSAAEPTWRHPDRSWRRAGRVRPGVDTPKKARLVARGRAKKIAIVACLRRFFGILKAFLKARTPWQAAGQEHGRSVAPYALQRVEGSGEAAQPRDGDTAALSVPVLEP